MEHLHPVTPHVIRELEDIHREIRKHDEKAETLKDILDKTEGVWEHLRQMEKYDGQTLSIGPRGNASEILRNVENLLNALKAAYTEETVEKLIDVMGHELTEKGRQNLMNAPAYFTSVLDEIKKTRKFLASRELLIYAYWKDLSPETRENIRQMFERLTDIINDVGLFARALEDLRLRVAKKYGDTIKRRNALVKRYGRRLKAILELHGLDVDVPDDPEKLSDLARTAVHRALPDIIFYMRRTEESRKKEKREAKKKLDIDTLERIVPEFLEGAAERMQRLHPEISALLRLEGLSPAERLDLLQMASRLDPEVLRVATKIFEKDTLEQTDVEWLLKNRDRLAFAFLHIDPSVGRPFLDLMEKLETVAKIREKGLPRIDTTNVEDAKRVLEHELLPVILKNWEIWASNVKTWAELYEALERLRRTREYNTRGVLRPTNIPGTPSTRELLEKLLRGAEVRIKGKRTIIMGLPLGRAEEVARILREKGVKARVNNRGMIVVEGAPQVLSLPKEEPRKSVEKEGGEGRVNEETDTLKEQLGREIRDAKGTLYVLLKSIAVALDEGSIRILKTKGKGREGIKIKLKRGTHNSTVVLSKEYWQVSLSAIGGLSEGTIKRLGDKAIWVDINALNTLLRAADEDLRRKISKIMERLGNKKNAKKGGKR